MGTKTALLTELTSLAEDDNFLVSDTSDGTSKRITADTLIDAVGGASASVTVTGTSHTADVDTPFILVDDDTAAAAVTITLPTTASASSKSLYIKKLGNTANVIIDADSAELIDGSLTFTLEAQHESVRLYSNGTFWSII